MLIKLRSIDSTRSAPIHESKSNDVLNLNTAIEKPADDKKHLDERFAYLDPRIETYKQMIQNNHEWKKVAPKSGEPTTVQKNEITYHWCPNHKAWTAHKPEEHKGKDFLNEGSGNDKNGKEINNKRDGASEDQHSKFKAKLAELIGESDSE